MIDKILKIYEILDLHERRHAFFLIILFIVSAPIEILGIASVMPFLAVLSNPDIVETNEYLSWAYDFFGFTDNQGFFIFLSIALFIGFTLTLCMQMIKQYAIYHFSHVRDATISSRLLSVYLQQPYAWFLQQHSADLGKNLLNEVSEVTGGVVMPVLKLFSEIMTFLLLIGFIIMIDPVIACVSFLLIGITYIVIYVSFRKMLKQIGKEKLVLSKDRFRFAQEAISAIKDIKVLGLENVYISLYRKPSLRYARLHIINLLLKNFPSYFMQIVVFGGILALVMWLLSANDNNLSAVIPVVGVFALAGRRLMPAVKEIYGAFISLKFNEPALDLLHRHLNLAIEPPVNSDKNNLISMSVKEKIELDNVHFTFENTDRAAIQNLSLLIHAKTTVGFVGQTGAGKTTAVDLIMGLLKPQTGTVKVDNNIITDANIRAWSQLIGYVPQHIFLADDTIAANIAFGVDFNDIDMSSVENAAILAELHEFVMSELPDGYQTTIGERGVRLSGGQRQRIGVARALYHEPEVLILDEATSALDNATERAVMDAVHNLSNKKTIILIAHRLSTVKSCDQIFLLDKGKLSATGTYNSLMEKSPNFRILATGV